MRQEYKFDPHNEERRRPRVPQPAVEGATYYTLTPRGGS